MVWTHFHNTYFFIETFVLALGTSTGLVLSDFSVTTFRNVLGLQSHEFGLLHIWVGLSTVLNTEGLSFSVWVPVVVSLVVSVVLVERVVQVTVHPRQLRDVPEEERHLSVLTILVVVSSSNWVYLFI